MPRIVRHYPLCKLLIVATLLALSLHAQASRPASRRSEADKPPAESRPAATSKPATPLAITAKDLLAEYQRSEKRANSILKGKLVEISGFVDKIGKDLQGKSYVQVRATRSDNDSGPYWIQCVLKKPLTANLWVGGKVTIRGVCEGLNLLNVVVKDGEIVQ